MFSNAYIPYRGYYSSPFCRWQGSFQYENSIILGATTANRWMKSRNLDPAMLDYLYFGVSIGQPGHFYGHTWAAGMLVEGNKDLPALMVNQACSTAVTGLQLAAMSIDCGLHEETFVLATDRCSNGPHTIWPNPLGPGAQVESENWVMDHFNNDPYAGQKMIQTAENVAREVGATKEECNEVTLRRYAQYQDSLADDRAFQKRYMMPVEVRAGKKKTLTVDQDEGVVPTTRDGLYSLGSVESGGVHTFGSQTHPADGNCGFLVTSRERARELSYDPEIEIQILSYGYARVGKGKMAAAPVPAARMALEKAGLSVEDLTAVKTHNPFAINDINMANSMGIDVMDINNYGSSLIYGHPQGPTSGRLIMELIEELEVLGGGYGLWAGCAAGDSGAAMVVKVG